MYSEVARDRKVQTLPLEQLRAWLNLLCLASENRPRGHLPPLGDIAYALRLSESRASAILESLIKVGLFDRDPAGAVRPHNWDMRQFETDSSNDRVRKYRDKIRAGGEKLAGYTKHRDAVYARDGRACVYCGSSEKLVLDHLIPVNRGGDGQPDNLVTACKSCNSGKSGRLVEESGYVIRRPETVTQYDTVKARLGVTPVTVTPEPVTVTVTPRVRADSDTDSDSYPETDSEDRETPSNDVVSGGRDVVVIGGGTFPIVSEEHRKTVEHAKAVISEKFAATVADRGSSLQASLGGRWDCYRAAIDALKVVTARKSIDQPAVYTLQTALKFAAHGIPTAADEAIRPDPANAPAPTSAPLTAAQERKRMQLASLHNSGQGAGKERP